MPGPDRGGLMLLAFDTCGKVGGVALGKLVAATTETHPAVMELVAQRELTGRSFSEQLLLTTAELLTESGVALDQLRGLAVVHGPGSFTGIRIGVSVVKGMAEALALPVVAVSRLELVARAAPGESAVALLDAGREEYFAGVYRGGRCLSELLLRRSMLGDLLSQTGLPAVICEESVAEALRPYQPKLVPAPGAATALAVAAERFAAGRLDDVAALDANYVRHSESEMLLRIAQHVSLKKAAVLGE